MAASSSIHRSRLPPKSVPLGLRSSGLTHFLVWKFISCSFGGSLAEARRGEWANIRVNTYILSQIRVFPSFLRLCPHTMHGYRTRANASAESRQLPGYWGQETAPIGASLHGPTRGAAAPQPRLAHAAPGRASYARRARRRRAGSMRRAGTVGGPVRAESARWPSCRRRANRPWPHAAASATQGRRSRGTQ